MLWTRWAPDCHVADDPGRSVADPARSEDASWLTGCAPPRDHHPALPVDGVEDALRLPGGAIGDGWLGRENPPDRANTHLVLPVARY